MLTFQPEPLFPLASEIEPLLRAHYDEIALHKERIPLDPDWSRYACLEERNDLRIYTVRDDGRLVGYNVFFLHHPIHYRSTRVATNDILYLTPEYRRGRAGLRLIQYAEDQLRNEVDKVTYHVKHQINDFRPLLHRLGYADEEVMVGKMM